jgi:hypothetical protein
VEGGLDDPSLGQLFCYCGKNGLIIDFSWKLEYYNMILDLKKKDNFAWRENKSQNPKHNMCL